MSLTIAFKISLLEEDAYALREQIASTATLFITFGQGSPPKLFGEIVTTHLRSPMHFCSSQNNEIM
jgi:hypothetical protein